MIRAIVLEDDIRVVTKCALVKAGFTVSCVEPGVTCLCYDYRMAFCIDFSLPIADELRRVTREQLSLLSSYVKAADEEGDAHAVHEARKCTKRLRALLRLPPKGFLVHRRRALDLGLRDLSESLAPAREADVLKSTLAALCSDVSFSVSQQDLEVITTQLVSVHSVIRGERRCQKSSITSRFPSGLEEAWTAVWASSTFDTLVLGLEELVRRGRRSFRDVKPGAPPELFHDCRKRVKSLLFTLRLCEPLWPVVLGALTSEADQLGNDLGQHHDLAELDGLLGKLLVPLPPEVELMRLRGVLDQRMRLLEMQIMAGGTRLFALKPRTWGKWLISCRGVLPFSCSS